MKRPSDNYILTRADAERLSTVARRAEQKLGGVKARYRRRVIQRGGTGGVGSQLQLFKITSVSSSIGDLFFEGKKVSVGATGTLTVDLLTVYDIMVFPAFADNTATCKNHYSVNSYVICYQQDGVWISTYHLPLPFYIT